MGNTAPKGWCWRPGTDSIPDRRITMNETLIAHVATNNGFDMATPAGNGSITLTTARHETRAVISPWLTGIGVIIQSPYPNLVAELARSVPPWPSRNDQFHLADLEQLAAFLRRTTQLSMAFRKQQGAAMHIGHSSTSEAIPAPQPEAPPDINSQSPTLSAETEIERIRRERIGQNIYRKALMEYWRGACAVTGITLPEVLRASHAKPWAECTRDAERLDVFNGFLLVANLDALFDRFLVSFDDQGKLMVSPRLSAVEMQKLGLTQGMKLRWVEKQHLPYLHWHRNQFILATSNHDVAP